MTRPPVLLFALLLAPGVARGQTGLTYVLEAELEGSPGGAWTVEQGPDISVARWSGPEEEGGGEVALVAGPAVGGLPAVPDDDLGGVLGVLFDPGVDLAPGYRKASVYGSGVAVVDSVRLELDEGPGTERIAGHEGRQHVLTARVWWRHHAADGTVTPVADAGRADLWFARDLPFSWIPFGVHPSRPGIALPLSFWWPEVAQAAASRYEGRFRDLGLLLRARVHDETRPAQDAGADVELVGTELRSALEVRDVRETGAAPEPGTYADFPRIPRPRVGTLRVISFVLDPCRSLAFAPGGRFELVVEGAPGYRSEDGEALVVLDGQDESYAVVAGGVGEGRSECTLVLLPGAVPGVGEFALEPPAVDPGGDVQGAIALHVSAEGPASRRIVILERGEVRIEKADAGGVSGRLRGTGWGLETRVDGPARVLEGVDLTLTFTAVPAPSP